MEEDKERNLWSEGNKRETIMQKCEGEALQGEAAITLRRHVPLRRAAYRHTNDGANVDECEVVSLA